jgi:hypothetical protein
MVIRSVDPLSCAKIAGSLYAILGLIFGALFSLAAMAGAFASGDNDLGAMGAVFGVGAIVLLPILYGCLGFVTTLLMAWLYNVVSGIVGGVEIQTE